MGFLSNLADRLLGPKTSTPAAEPPQPPVTMPHELRGGGAFGLALVGESDYQTNLKVVAGGRRREGVNVVRTAMLVLEDSNRHDRKAVRVDVRGYTIGYLTRDKARKYRDRLGDLGVVHSGFTCSARIICGEDRGDGVRRSFGAWLDLDLRKNRRAGADEDSPAPTAAG
jgi:hypothetical protein